MGDRRPSTRAALGAALAALVGLAAAPGCATKECEGDSLSYGGRAGEGRIVDRDTWVSGELDGRWIDFAPQRTVFVTIPEFRGRTPLSVQAWISPVAVPNLPAADGAAADNFTVAAGNLAEFLQFRGDSVRVFNATCAQYFLRVLVKVEPLGAGPESSADAAAAETSSPPSAADATAE